MIGASKILTVSYGTFSCTLEGFDDPFNTMKAIAEYFRDLAAGDRYFGAEPPTPDAAMLHRIAEREVQRRVEAKVQDNGVILRAQYDEPPTATPEPVYEAPTAQLADAPPAAVQAGAVLFAAPAALDVPAASDVAAIPATSVSEMPATETSALAPADFGVEPIAADPVDKAPVVAAAVVQPGLSGMPEGVVARLAKIRAAVALTDAAPQVPAASEYVEDQHAETAFAAVEVFEDSVVPSVFDVSYAGPEEPEDLDESHELAALDGLELNTASFHDSDLSADADADVVEDTRARETSVSDSMAENLYLASETAQDAQSGVVFADADGDLDDFAHADLALEDDVQDGLEDALVDALNDVQEPAIQPPAETAYEHAAVSAATDHYDATSDDDVLANLSAAFADTSPATNADTTNADTIVFNDDDDALLAELAASAKDQFDAEFDGYATSVTDAAPIDTALAADIAQADEAEESDLYATDAEPDHALTHAMQDADAADATLPDMIDPDQYEQSAQDTVFAEDIVEETPTGPVDELPAIAADATAFDENAVPSENTVPPENAAPSEKLQRARARIIRVRRAPEIALAPAAPATAPVVLSDEAEAELQRELEALEAATTEATAKAAASVEANTEADDELRRMLGTLSADDTQGAAVAAVSAPAKPRDPAVQDESLRRLMDQTQSEMAEPSNRRRLSSIAHLKAAVAATIAERFGNKPKPAEEVEATRTEPYRNDLARAVRPVRPASATTPGQTERPGPLVLVSEQRIDRPAPVAPAAQGPVTPVRPRRVSAQAVAVQQSYEDDDLDAEEDDTDNIFGDAKGFAEFADRIGANELSELLEAAAAYSAAVEGREHFTRPQLLRQIASVTGGEVSREDELRGFGTLLRDGRIVKVRRGQFALTDASSYLTKARKISG